MFTPKIIKKTEKTEAIEVCEALYDMLNLSFNYFTYENLTKRYTYNFDFTFLDESNNINVSRSVHSPAFLHTAVEKVILNTIKDTIRAYPNAHVKSLYE